MRILSLGLWLCAQATALFLPNENTFDDRTTSDPGCTGGSNLQKIELNSGVRLFELFVPVDSQTYVTWGDSRNLRCADISTSGAPCVDCNFCTDHIQLKFAGFCDVEVKGVNGKTYEHTVEGTQKLTFGTPGYLSKIKCYSNLDKRTPINDKDASISCAQTQNSSVNLISGSQNYTLNVPPDKNTYPTLGPQAILGCVYHEKWMTSLCSACNFPVNALQVAKAAGVCKFELSGNLPPLWLDHNAVDPFPVNPPAQILSARCGLTWDDLLTPPSIPNDKRRSNTLVSSKGSMSAQEPSELKSADERKCLTMNSSKVNLFVWMCNIKYSVPIPTDDNIWWLQDKYPDLACLHYEDKSDAICYNCSAKIDKIRFDGPPNSQCEIRFKLDHDEYPGTQNMTSFPLQINSTTSDSDATDVQFMPFIPWIRCWINKDTPAPSKSDTDVPRSSTPSSIASPDPNCKSHDYKTVITTTDMNIYFAPVPRDNQTHWMADEHCIRLNDAACIPCMDIGAATSIQTMLKYGPCTFTTIDDQEFTVPYTEYSPLIGSGVTAPVPISPPSIVVGIECSLNQNLEP